MSWLSNPFSREKPLEVFHFPPKAQAAFDKAFMPCLKYGTEETPYLNTRLVGNGRSIIEPSATAPKDRKNRVIPFIVKFIKGHLKFIAANEENKKVFDHILKKDALLKEAIEQAGLIPLFHKMLQERLFEEAKVRQKPFVEKLQKKAHKELKVLTATNTIEKTSCEITLINFEGKNRYAPKKILDYQTKTGLKDFFPSEWKNETTKGSILKNYSKESIELLFVILGGFNIPKTTSVKHVIELHTMLDFLNLIDLFLPCDQFLKQKFVSKSSNLLDAYTYCFENLISESLEALLFDSALYLVDQSELCADFMRSLKEEIYKLEPNESLLARCIYLRLALLFNQPILKDEFIAILRPDINQNYPFVKIVLEEFGYITTDLATLGLSH